MTPALAAAAQLATFAAYSGGGFASDLLPITAPDGRISPTTKSLVPEKMGKVPGKLLPDGSWVGRSGWTNAPTSPADIIQWDVWRSGRPNGAGIGLRGRRFPAIDLDVNDPAMTARLMEVVLAVVGPAPCRHTVDTVTGELGSRCLLLYRGDNLSSWVSIKFTFNGASHEVEMKATNRQCVMEGKHPSRGVYAWTDDGSPATWGADRLTLLTKEAADLLRAALVKEIEQAGGVITNPNASGTPAHSGTARVDQESLCEPKPGATARLLAQCPNEESYDGWLSILRAAKASGGEAAYDAAEEWSLKWGGNTADDVRAKWDSLSPPHQIGWHRLSAWAAAHGIGTAAEEFEAIGDAAGSGTSGCAQQAMFNRYVWVEDTETFVDLNEGHRCTEKVFNVRNCAVGPPDSHQKRASSVFFRDELRRKTVRSETYRPGGAQFVSEAYGECVNVWRGPVPVPKGPVTDAEVAPWLDHLAYLIPDRVERDIYLDWTAWVVQRPDHKPNWSVLIGGVPGIGKSLVIEPMRRALGSHNVREIGPPQLSSPFNDWLVNSKLIVVDEMNTFEKKQVMDTIKTLIASPPFTHEINRKYGRQSRTPNIQACVFFTNHRDALAIECGDRRFFVLWSPAEPKGKAYFDGLTDWYKAGGADAAARWLLARDLSGFDAKGRAPQTAAKDEMRDASRSGLEEWIGEGVVDATGPFASDIIALKDIWHRVPSDINWRGTRPTEAKISAALHRAGGKPLGKVFLGKHPPGCAGLGDISKEPRLFSIRNHSRYSAMPATELRQSFWEERMRAQQEADELFDTPSEPPRARLHVVGAAQGQGINQETAHVQ